MLNNKKVLLLILLLITSGCANDLVIKKMKSVDIKTKDNVTLVADYYEGNNKGVILLHMLGRNKESWGSFPKELNEKGYSVVAIDLRGHGKSSLNYKDFTEEDFNNMIYDVEAAKEYLKLSDVAVIGASIGANIALKVGDDFSTSVLLSPGLNFRGVDISNDETSKPVLLIASEDDPYSVDSSKKIIGNLPNGQFVKYRNKGHGTNMLDEETKELIVKWLDEKL